MDYKTIYADPPWYEKGGGKIKRGADKHYPLMKTKDICNLQIIKDLNIQNAHLYLWVTNNFLKDGLEVMEAWEFKYITNIVWVKDKMGLGQYFRGKHELCLFGRKGKLPYKVINGKRQQSLTVLYADKTEHSHKPHEMYSVIERISYEPYIELFARNTRENWDSWGNEILKESEEVNG